MQAWILDRSPGAYRFGEVICGEPGPGEVRVRVVASAVNHMDLWLTEGRPKPALPHIPGSDGAGVIEAIGPGRGDVALPAPEDRADGSEHVAIGDEVVLNPAVSCRACCHCLAGESPYCARFHILGEQCWGTHAESVVLPAANVAPKPPGRSWEESAAFGLCTLTAWRMLRRCRLTAGERVLIVGVGGGVSSAGLVLARAMGARVFATSRHAAKRAWAVAMGAEAVFDSERDFPTRMDVVFDNVGAATWSRSLRALGPGGRLVTCGGTAGVVVEVNLPRLFFRQHEIIGSTMGSYAEWDAVLALVGTGLPVVVDDVVDGLEAYPEALARLAEGRQLGKLVVRH